MKQLTPDELKAWKDEGKTMSLIDVREGHEWKEGHFDNAIHLPLSLGEKALIERISTLPRPRVLYCASGSRSHRLGALLSNEGIDNIYNLQFGYHGYQLFHS